MSVPIEDYALIGDCETAALVSKNGSIDWLCFPRFDSPSCFAALLGAGDNGFWSLSPSGENVRVTRRYRNDTLILETEFQTETGAAVLIDFMPLRDGTSDLMRIVEGKSGTVAFDMELNLRFDYGRTVPWVTHGEDGGITAIAGPDRLTLNCAVPLEGRGLSTVGSFQVAAGESQIFTLTWSPSHMPQPAQRQVEYALPDTEEFWLSFAAACPKVGQWTEQVKRSLITLKALTYMPTGGIIAAATTSLPEKIGGPRNWDYRYCWLRDATLTLLALMKLGYYEEASAWRKWLLRAVAGAPAQMQIMYGVAGERNLLEWQVPWLSGYEGSTPVRIGNAAAEQVQLDVYGEVADAMLQARKGGLPPHHRERELAAAILPFLEKIWVEPDEGIWEVRGQRQHFTYSKVMAWVAFDRAVQIAEADGEPEAAARWRTLADHIHAEVCEKAFDPELGCFTQAYGSKAMDASLLQLGMVGFIPPDDPRYVATVEAIERKLLRDDLLLRYETQEVDDGLPPGEGAFLACSFWLVDALGMIGRRDDALRLFERLLNICNDVGLLAEEYDPAARRMLGNFPQAFSHIGLINSALNLARLEGPADQRSA
ncbi:GH15 family glucan-1,4-alpha-glucosidase [Rhizobium leguminosarum]|uniref:Trehalase n=1 Tax=Rhizobium leguminosarum TaxID=384 RepID=A0AAE2MIP5_RHILE|nr:MULTISPECIES: glycoside hydrolase family 15 protein [Rhizobium]MBB4289849.1 GH15 family glucan-1,4-alpha-glucosidase [Rhizobium leguminosarum]MBB4296492.1 GH15 family glucan-1,4-alpha-glucosidase [Rhizobium leguminosarum]MBB4308247.1 GH15 family glucan-1,4-alpha-glucosidase [Rhizobium leguminosarum]MBB4416083.1 GH15 family glucan-1,4-alpha-glucosidase [Rhizobium leguminosarum]MBB4430950.1 GH15 family glucan-1,4-alpha-glucosidase [Rhizobium esperanzae]